MQYFGSHVSTKAGYAAAMKCAVEHKMTSIQIELGDLTRGTTRNPDQLDVKEYQALREEHGIKVFVHMPYVLNTAHPEKLGWCKKVFKDWIGVGEKLGIDGLVWHPGSHKDLSMEDSIKVFQDFVNYLLEKTNILLLPENTAGAGTAIANDVKRLFDIIETFPKDRVKITLDTCHAWASGLDLRTTADKIWLHANEDRIGLVHANNSLDPLASHRDRHASILNGEIPTEDLVKVLSYLSNVPQVLERSKELPLEEVEVLRNL